MPSAVSPKSTTEDGTEREDSREGWRRMVLGHLGRGEELERLLHNVVVGVGRRRFTLDAEDVRRRYRADVGRCIQYGHWRRQREAEVPGEARQALRLVFECPQQGRCLDRATKLC